MNENIDEQNDSSTVMRLQKAMAHAGVASRRVCEELIQKGRVYVNGKVVKELGSRVDTAVDKVEVNGIPLQFDTSRVYLAFNKPLGVVSSMADEQGRVDLSMFVADYDRVFNVGRLDAETTGLLIMTIAVGAVHITLGLILGLFEAFKDRNRTHLLERGGGSVINVASFVAILGAATSQISYTASKGGVHAVTMTLAVTGF